MERQMKETVARLTKEAIQQVLAAPVRLESVEVAELGGAVDLRYPTFPEWHSLAMAHRALDGKPAPADLILATVAVVLANPDGTRMFPDEGAEVLEAMPIAAVMEIYVAAWSSVLRAPEAGDEAKKD
jgi:hypothetical protein